MNPDYMNPDHREPQWIDIPGAHNVRDVGGLPAQSGRTRSGVLLRGDNLDDITEDGMQVVVEGLRLGSVIDLRTPDEAPDAHERIVAAGIAQLRLPLIDLSGTTSPSALREQYGDDSPKVYQHMLEQAGPAIVSILDFVLEDGHLPTLVHCAAGKDRTGITVAVLLAVAGVDENAIVTDYVATGQRLARVRESLQRKEVYRGIDMSRAPLDVPPGPIEGVLHALTAEPGGVVGFLIRHGATTAAIDRWRTAILATDGDPLD
jgi:protein-tyrosine phosphatase